MRSNRKTPAPKWCDTAAIKWPHSTEVFLFEVKRSRITSQPVANSMRVVNEETQIPVLLIDRIRLSPPGAEPPSPRRNKQPQGMQPEWIFDPFLRAHAECEQRLGWVGERQACRNQHAQPEGRFRAPPTRQQALPPAWTTRMLEHHPVARTIQGAYPFTAPKKQLRSQGALRA